MFPRVNLFRADQHISVHGDNIPKTATTAPYELYDFDHKPFELRNDEESVRRFISQAMRNLSTISNDESKHLSYLSIVQLEDEYC